jgi:transposase
MLADQANRVEFLIGVDTHKESHSAGLLSGNGGVLSKLEVRTTEAGYRQLLDWAEEHAKGTRVWAIEGTASYGTGLTSFLQGKGERVAEIDRPTRTSRGKSGAKSDTIDAIRAAREARDEEKLASPRQRGRREALRVLQTAREGVVKQHTTGLNQLHALVLTAPEQLRTELRTLSASRLVERCARFRINPRRDVEWNGYLRVLRSISQRLRGLEAEGEEYLKQIEELTQLMAPELCAEPGVGPVSGAQILISWSHQGRLHSEAAFAALAGVSPIEASSGQYQRHRLNRGGDRQLNRALHTIVMSRIQHHAPTQEYVARRRAEGKSDREIRRCLKRYLARHLFRLMERTVSTDIAPQIAA